MKHDCGCYIYRQGICLCPLHEAAPAFREASWQVLEEFEGVPCPNAHEDPKLCALDRLGSLVAQTEGVKP